MVFYRTYDGDILTSEDLEKSFYIITGLKHFDYPEKFWKFREKCFGKSIKETIPSDIEYLCKEGYRLYAIKLFREQNNCSLMDAKNIIDKYCKDHKYYPYNFDF